MRGTAPAMLHGESEEGGDVQHCFVCCPIASSPASAVWLPVSWPRSPSMSGRGRGVAVHFAVPSGQRVT